MTTKDEELITILKGYGVDHVAGPHRLFGFWPDVAGWMERTERRLESIERAVTALAQRSDRANPL